MNEPRTARSNLWEKALRLPQARDADFFGANRRPAGVDPEHVRVIGDTSLRTRLIDAGIAEGLQSPKGPQKIASIIRLYPNFDAPPKGSKPARNGRAPARNGESPARSSAFGLPTVEELNALLARIQSVEMEVSGELQRQLNADIARLKRDIGHLEGDDFERAFRELDRALTARRQLAGQIREEAFRRIDAESGFEPRKYLRLIARGPRE